MSDHSINNFNTRKVERTPLPDSSYVVRPVVPFDHDADVDEFNRQSFARKEFRLDESDTPSIVVGNDPVTEENTDNNVAGGNENHSGNHDPKLLSDIEKKFADTASKYTGIQGGLIHPEEMDELASLLKDYTGKPVDKLSLELFFQSIKFGKNIDTNNDHKSNDVLDLINIAEDPKKVNLLGAFSKEELHRLITGTSGKIKGLLTRNNLSNSEREYMDRTKEVLYLALKEYTGNDINEDSKRLVDNVLRSGGWDVITPWNTPSELNKEANSLINEARKKPFSIKASDKSIQLLETFIGRKVTDDMRNTINSYLEFARDINGDGEINVKDILEVVNNQDKINTPFSTEDSIARSLVNPNLSQDERREHILLALNDLEGDGTEEDRTSAINSFLDSISGKDISKLDVNNATELANHMINLWTDRRTRPKYQTSMETIKNTTSLILSNKGDFSQIDPEIINTLIDSLIYVTGKGKPTDAKAIASLKEYYRQMVIGTAKDLDEDGVIGPGDAIAKWDSLHTSSNNNIFGIDIDALLEQLGINLNNNNNTSGLDLNALLRQLGINV